MEFTKIRQGGLEYSIAFPNGEATLFGGIAPNATITHAGVTALSTDVIVWNVATSQFVLRRGITFYDAWSASADGTVEEAGAWIKKLTPGAHFYTDSGDGTMRWFYYDGTQMLETSAETNEEVTEILADHETRITDNTLTFAAPLAKSDRSVSLNVGNGLEVNGTKLALTDDIISQIQTLALRQLYLAAGATYSAATGYYTLNGIKDIDEAEMKSIYSYNVRVDTFSHFSAHSYRTFLNNQSEPIAGNSAFYNCKNVIVAPNNKGYIFLRYTTANNMLYNCIALRKTATYSISLTTNKDWLKNAAELVEYKLQSWSADTYLGDQVRFSYYSLDYLAAIAVGGFTLTLSEKHAAILMAFAAKDAAGSLYATEDGTLNLTATFADPAEIRALSETLAAMPWEAKLKKTYDSPIWREDKGTTITFNNRCIGGSLADTMDNAAVLSDARPSLIKHEKGADGSYIYPSWTDYVSAGLASDLSAAGTELAQYTTAENATFATSLQDWYLLYLKMKEKNITIASAATAEASAAEASAAEASADEASATEQPGEMS